MKKISIIEMIDTVTKGIHEIGKGQWAINELEVSITSKCHLRCDNCGFLVPAQPSPSLSHDTVMDISRSLEQLQRLNIHIRSLAILGGEPTFNTHLLEKALHSFSQFQNIDRLEVVTHGLTPQGITPKTLPLIDKLTISVYYDNAELSKLWSRYVQAFSETTEIAFRTDHNWDPWHTKLEVGDNVAQDMFDRCWYRRHCTTIERGRLFVCSRIPKEGRDSEGILLSETTTQLEIIAYLNRTQFLPSCKECTPMMGLETIQGGQQPDDRVQLLAKKAVSFFQQRLNGEIA